MSNEDLSSADFELLKKLGVTASCAGQSLKVLATSLSIGESIVVDLSNPEKSTRKELTDVELYSFALKKERTKAGAARYLGVSRGTVIEKIKKHKELRIIMRNIKRGTLED